jgi:hypothetical protein
VARRHAVSEATIYNWKAKYGGLEVSEAKRLRSLEEENAKLKRHIFAAPNVARANSKSELRRAVETADTTEAKAIGLDQQRTRNQRGS